MYELNEYRKENLKVSRLYVLRTLKQYKTGSYPAEVVASSLLELRRRLILPWMIAEYWNEDHPYATFSKRTLRIATTLMGKEWVESYLEDQKKDRH